MEALDRCTMMMLLVSLLLLGCACANPGVQSADADDMELTNRETRNFGYSGPQTPFTLNKNDNMVDWRAFFAQHPGMNKRQLEGFEGNGFGRSSVGLGNGNFQNWKEFFGRHYRSFNGIGGSKSFGNSDGGFGADGLQNWRAFFEGRRGRGYRK